MSVARTVSITGGNQTIKKLFFKEGEIMVRLINLYIKTVKCIKKVRRTMGRNEESRFQTRRLFK